MFICHLYVLFNVFFFTFEVGEFFFLLFWIWLIYKYMIWNYFLPVGGLSFPCLNRVFHRAVFFLILMKFILSNFYLMDCVFGIISKNLSFNTKSWRFSTISSFKILYFYLTNLVCNNPFRVQFWYVNLGQGSFFGHWYPLFLTIC